MVVGIVSVQPSAVQAVGVCSGYIYWGNYNLGSAPYSGGRATISNSGITAISNSFFSPIHPIQAIAGDDSYLYYADNFRVVYKVDKVTLDESLFFTSLGTVIAMTISNGKLFIGSTWRRMYKYDISGSSAIQDTTFPFSESGATPGAIGGIAVDENYLYYATGSDNTIGRADLDGLNNNPSFINLPLENVASLVINSNYIYWRDYAKTIRRADIDGNNITTLITTTKAYKIAIDSDYLYFDGYNSSAPFSIARANLDGTEIDLTYISPTGNMPTALYVETNPCPTVTTQAVQDDGAWKQTITPTEVLTSDASFTLKNRKYLSKNSIKTKLRKNESFKRNPKDSFKYSIFKTSKKSCIMRGNYVMAKTKTGACEMWVTRTTTQGAKYKYWVQINYSK